MIWLNWGYIMTNWHLYSSNNLNLLLELFHFLKVSVLQFINTMCKIKQKYVYFDVSHQECRLITFITICCNFSLCMYNTDHLVGGTRKIPMLFQNLYFSQPTYLAEKAPGKGSGDGKLNFVYICDR